MAPPEFSENPIVDYSVERIEKNDSHCEDHVDFTCSITHGDEDLLVLVKWSLDDKALPERTVPYAEMPAKLTREEIIENGIVKYGFTVSHGANQSLI